MQISYGQLEAALMAVHAIHPDRAGTFKSRIKQLQRLKFPEGVNIGRGAKMAYGAEHFYKLAAAFSLLQAGIAAERATRLISENWETLKWGFGLSSLKLATGEKPNRTIYAVLFERLLSDIQIEPDQDKSPRYPVHVVSEKYLGTIMREGWHNYAHSVIRVTDLVRAAGRALADVGVQEPWHDWEFADWTSGIQPQNVLIAGD